MNIESGIFEITQQFCKSDDRWVLIERNLNSEIVGLNFMQGDNLELFKEHWNESDPGLLKFFDIIRENLFPHFYYSDNREAQLKILNRIIWAFVEERTS